ncbi:MAG: hypothetical protein ACPG5Z_00160 [Pseudoalteromonas sp.]
MEKLIKTTHTLDYTTILFLRYYSTGVLGQENQSAAIRAMTKVVMDKLNVTKEDLERWDSDLCH